MSDRDDGRRFRLDKISIVILLALIAVGASNSGLSALQLPIASASASAEVIAVEGSILSAALLQAAAQQHAETTLSSTPGFTAESPPYAAVRWFTFMGLLGAVGAVAFRLIVLGLVARSRDPEGVGIVSPAAVRAARLGLAAVALLAVALLLRLLAQSYAVFGGDRAFDSALITTLLSETTWGRGWLLQAAGTVVALIGFSLADKDRRIGWATAAVGVLALAFTPALSGHAVATPDLTALAVLSDGLHVLGAGGWLGSLFAVVAVGIPVALRRPQEERGAAVAALINAFSPTALVFAGVVVTTGFFAAWLQLGSIPALWETTYGRTLLLKLAVLSVVFGTGAYNWLKVKPTLGSEVAAGRLKRSALLELAVGTVVLAITAVLVATATPAMMIDMSQSTGSPEAAAEMIH